MTLDRVFFDPEGEVAFQTTDPDITSASDAELEAALADLFEQIEGDRREARFHDRDAYFAEFAGSEKCQALGHTWDAEEDSWMPYDDHPSGWDSERICEPTRHGSACSTCESDDCPARRLDVDLWSAPGVTGGDRG